MSESERSGGYSKDFGTPDESPLSRSDAAELEQLRREASVLREQLKDALGSQGAAGASSGRSRRATLTWASCGASGAKSNLH